MKRILIVDDEAQILKALVRLFIDTDYEVLSAEGGAQALEMLEAEKFDLVISDMRMPNMDGYDLLNRVKEMYPSILRVILSGYTDEKIVIKALQNNIAKLYLYKPWNNEQLITIVKNLFDTEDILLEKRLLEIVNNYGELPTIKKSFQAIIHLIEQDAEFDEITREIEKDLSISSKLLHIVNSAFYGIRTGSIKQAAVYIGMKNIRNIVLSTSIIDSLEKNKKMEKIIDDQWAFAFLTNKILAFIYEKLLRKQLPDDSIAAGLMHNLGVIFLLNAYKDEYGALIEKSINTGIDLLTLENEKYGTTHEAIGGYLLSWWELPFPIVESAIYHHDPSDGRILNKELVAAVHLSLTTASRMLNFKLPFVFHEDVFDILGFGKEDYERLMHQF